MNSLSPVKLGATWSYLNKGGPVNEVGFRTTITSVRPAGFTVTTRFDDQVQVDQQWACKPEGLVALSLGAGQTALDLTLEGINAQLDTSNARGVTIPAQVQTGMKWPYGLDIAGTLSQADQSAKVNGALDATMEAIAAEKVTVPAGTFQAMRIQTTSNVKLSANYLGLNIPITSVVNTTFWFAPGVGWIKAEQTGDLAGTTLDSTTELQSYSIP